MEQNLEKPYLTARKASELLGVPLEAVVADIDRGVEGHLSALIGASVGGIYMVPSWELEGDRLAMHRARLTRTGEADATQPLPPLARGIRGEPA